MPLLAVFASGLVGLVVAGPGGAVAAVLMSGLVYHRRYQAIRHRAHQIERAALLEALGVLRDELRAGTHPARATAVASGGTAQVHRVLAAVSVGARLGAAVPAMLERYAAGLPAIADDLRRLASAWVLAERHGVALGELTDAVQTDLRARARLSGQVRAQLAGPRATATVLSVLPALGLLLGQGVGADPWHVLTESAAGQLLLVVGSVLICAGLLWSGRIIARAGL